MQLEDAEPLLTPAEVATLFRVDPKTATRWAKAGKLTSIRTLGGHRRYREREVRRPAQGDPAEQPGGSAAQAPGCTRCGRHRVTGSAAAVRNKLQNDRRGHGRGTGRPHRR